MRTTDVTVEAGVRPRLFGEFAAGGPEGVGLGLWIVRRLAEAHGGWAVAEARDPGVAMIVAFPASPAGSSARSRTPIRSVS